MLARSRATSGGSASSLATILRTASVSAVRAAGPGASALAGSPGRFPRKRMKDMASPSIPLAAALALCRRRGSGVSEQQMQLHGAVVVNRNDREAVRLLDRIVGEDDRQRARHGDD